jgi:glycosyltransferase involved in cell wall biosynthesis
MDKTMEMPFRNFILINKQGKLLPGRNFKKSEKPKISIIIPIYNEEKNLIKIIRSIQNQSLQEIEIVCINDNSNDNTLSILTSLQKVDPRITIINNKINRGVLYNRIFGAMQSKGEYVTFVDADDCFCNIDILSLSYETATQKYNEKIDIVHYQSCGAVPKGYDDLDDFLIFFTFNPSNFNQVIRQPEIGDNYMQKKKHVTGSGLVFDKIYSRELMFRIADYISPQIWNQNLVFLDDFLLAFASMKMAKSIVNIGVIGYFHLIDVTTSTTSNVWQYEGNKLKNPEKANKKIGDYMIILETMLQLTENEPGSGEFREKIINDLLEDQYLSTIARSIHYEKLISLFEKIYNWKYSDKETKKRIKKSIKKIFDYYIDTKKKYDHLLD